jgi:hypothetical protein
MICQNQFFPFAQINPQKADVIDKQAVHQGSVQDRQFQHIEGVRQADALFPARNHTGTLEAQNRGYLRLFEPSGLPVLPKAVQRFSVVIPTHVLWLVLIRISERETYKSRAKLPVKASSKRDLLKKVEYAKYSGKG